MNFRSLLTRTAVAGATSALAASALVGATTVAANAVEASTDYACALSSPIQSPLGTFNLVVSTPVIPPTATAGQSFPGGLLALDATLTIPSPTGAALANYKVDHADATDYAVGLGSTSIAAPIAFGAPTVHEDGSATVLGTAANQPFTLPPAGTYKAMLPSAFTMDTTIDMGSGPIPATIACTSDAPGDLGSVQVTKGVSATAGKVAKTAKGYKATATVTRVGDDVVPAGKVIAKLGTTKVATKALKKGKAVFALPQSARGKKLTLIYKGDGYTQGSKTSLKVK